MEKCKKNVEASLKCSLFDGGDKCVLWPAISLFLSMEVIYMNLLRASEFADWRTSVGLEIEKKNVKQFTNTLRGIVSSMTEIKNVLERL